MIQKIAIIGAGTMGNGIAHVFAQNNFKVTLVDVSSDALQKALLNISKNLDRVIAKGNLTEGDKKRTLDNIQVFSEIQEGVAEADLVIEAATENADLKLQIFKDLDTYSKPNAILASNTSSI